MEVASTTCWMTRAVVIAPSKLVRVVIVRLRIRVQPERKKKITSTAKNIWIAANGAEVAMIWSSELGVSTRTACARVPGAWPNSRTTSSMNRSRFA